MQETQIDSSSSSTVSDDDPAYNEKRTAYAARDKETQAEIAPVIDLVEDSNAAPSTAAASRPDNQFVELWHTKFWWVGAQGVIDFRLVPPAEFACQVMADVRQRVDWIIDDRGGSSRIRFKIGVAYCPFHRWRMYKRLDAEPFTHLFVLYETQTREAAFVIECYLIWQYWGKRGCINTERRDRGGTGPQRNLAAGPNTVYIVARVAN